MFAELEARLYKLRDVEDAALAEFDDACAQHDSEMDRIRTALHQKFSAVPFLEMYKQQFVRQQKAKDFERGLWWAERGLALYGTDAYSHVWTDDLKKRFAWFRTKLESPPPAAPTRCAEVSGDDAGGRELDVHTVWLRLGTNEGPRKQAAAVPLLRSTFVAISYRGLHVSTAIHGRGTTAQRHRSSVRWFTAVA